MSSTIPQMFEQLPPGLLESWETAIDAQADQLDPQLVAIRRHLHSHPEPSGQELETTRYLAAQLREQGLSPVTFQNDAGQPVGMMVDVTLGNPPEDAPLIAIRSDIDALRMQDEKQVDYASQRPGLCHACGHDVHSTIVLGAAFAGGRIAGQILQGMNQLPPETAGLRLRLIFQPAEETSSGARWLVEQGAVDGVAGILGLHVDPERPVGTVGVRYGVLTANCDDVLIQVRGHGGHAARPHHSIDPIATAAQLVSALYTWLPRSVDSRSASVFTIGRIEGGFAPNVIPEMVELHASLRTVATASRERICQRIDEICAGTATSSGCRISVHYEEPLAGVDNVPQFTRALELASSRVLGSSHVHRIEAPSMGGEDFSAYLARVPGAMLRLGCAAPERQAHFLHSPLFDIDERAIAIGVRIMLRAAVLLSATGVTSVSPEGS